MPVSSLSSPSVYFFFHNHIISSYIYISYHHEINIYSNKIKVPVYSPLAQRGCGREAGCALGVGGHPVRFSEGMPEPSFAVCGGG